MPPELPAAAGRPALVAEPRRSYDDETFRRAAATARTLSELCRALGLAPRGANYDTLRSYASQHGIDLRHLETAIRRRPDVSRAELRAAMQGAQSRAEILRSLGQEPTSAAYGWLRREARRHAVRIDVAGQAWAAGRQRPRRVPVQRYLVQGPPRISSSRLRERLVESGLLKPRCDTCARTTWQQRPIPLELDHISGDRTDNRLENLRLLCPNCHALTPTYRGRNIGRRT